MGIEQDTGLAGSDSRGRMQASAKITQAARNASQQSLAAHSARQRSEEL